MATHRLQLEVARGVLILPGHPLFNATLGATLPPGWQQTAAVGNEALFVVRPGLSGLFTPATPHEWRDYLEGGEYEARLEELGDDLPDG
ncbi:hypothetical protein [Leptolyngbya sp. FACHB-261]|uniref:hypothetical protein n=1 Tax=Leptolyngbya sp. FACHB-261 TaxID=2692806 RepID=UPI001688445C|nr:hypothetical protein [Leptolyngbya sp. FACHB-261]MBD2100264.1 hypothetical protein [Leptolyngbya sp. FACHB-261]